MKIWGIHKRYSTLSWWENFMGGHMSIGPITIFGHNSMLWVLVIRTKRWGHINITLPSIARKRRGWSHHIYCSPNGTPWACTFYIGGDRNERIRSKIRRWALGHNFDTTAYWSILQTINNKFSWFHIAEYDIEKFGPKKEKGDFIPKGDLYTQTSDNDVNTITK